MVFSNELVPSRLGSGLVVPCRSTVSTPEQLVDEAEELWAAEHKRSDPRAVSTEWGAVGLLVNPQKNVSDEIKIGWSRRVAKEGQHYEEFRHSAKEQAAVNREGMLTIPWPKAKSVDSVNVDILLATANQPCLINGLYATPQMIADAWKKNPDERGYFERNCSAGILTAADDCIMQLLKQ
jgi:hypothetical protein